MGVPGQGESSSLPTLACGPLGGCCDGETIRGFINSLNELTGVVTIAGTGGIGVTVAAGTITLSISGITSYAVGDILYASTTTTLAKLAGVAAGNVLISGGVSTAPSWGKVALTTHVSGTLPVANGGTANTTVAANRAAYYWPKFAGAGGSDVLAATPDVAGQLVFSTDLYFAGAHGTGAGNVYKMFLVDANRFYLLNDITRVVGDLEVTGGSITKDGTGTTTLTSTGAFTDNSLWLHNKTATGASKGYSAVVCVSGSDSTPSNARAAVLGFGQDGISSEYVGKGYLALNGDSPVTDPPPDFGIYAEQDNGSGNIAHRRIFFDNTNKTILLYGWSNSASAGTVGLTVETDGSIAIGGGASATEFRLKEPSGGGTSYTGFKAPALAGNVIYTLPIADGSANQVLSTNGSAALSWVSRPRVLFTKTTTTGNVGAGNDTLWSVTIPVVLVNDGDRLEIEGAFIASGGATGSTIDLNWNGVLVYQLGVGSGITEAPVNIKATILRTGATAQLIFGFPTPGEAGGSTFNTTGSATLSGTVVLSFTGESLDGGTDSVILKGGHVTYYPAP